MIYMLGRKLIIKMNNNPINLNELLELREIYLELKELAAKVQDFEDRHKFADKMKKSLDKAISELVDSAHILYRDIYQIKKENYL